MTCAYSFVTGGDRKLHEGNHRKYLNDKLKGINRKKKTNRFEVTKAFFAEIIREYSIEHSK